MKRKDLKGKRVAALVSGGLDSTTIVHWLSSAGVKVLAITVDLGQPDEKDMRGVAERMRKAGAEEAIILYGKTALAEYMLKVIQGLAHHEGGYMNTTGIARMATVATALPEISKRGINIMTHGATGRGNDQVRFELGTIMLAPEMTVYAPWRDTEFVKELGGRKQMIEYCRRHRLKVTATLKKPYSTDANFAGLTHEAGVLEQLDSSPHVVDFVMGVEPIDAPVKPETVKITFKKGVPEKVNGQSLALVGIFQDLNLIAGRNGVGIGIDVVENRRVGIKSRGVYESPGATLLEIVYAKLLQQVLDRERRKFFEIVSRQLADVVYEGEWFSPLASDLLAVVNNVAQYVTGTVVCELYKGNVTFLEIKDVPHSLYNPDVSSMEKTKGFDHTDSQGYLNVAAVRARALAYTRQTRYR